MTVRNRTPAGVGTYTIADRCEPRLEPDATRLPLWAYASANLSDGFVVVGAHHQGSRRRSRRHRRQCPEICRLSQDRGTTARRPLPLSRQRFVATGVNRPRPTPLVPHILRHLRDGGGSQPGRGFSLPQLRPGRSRNSLRREALPPGPSARSSRTFPHPSKFECEYSIT
jgi:hypothetical protein